MSSSNNKTQPPHWFFKFLPLILFGIFFIVVYGLLASKPDTKRRKPPEPNKINVETLILNTQNIPVSVRSFGLVAPRIESKIVAQVGGKITFISDALRDGGFFEKGETLAQIEKTDYRAAVDIASANVASSERAYLEEEAQAKQAEEDWGRLGNQGTPSKLTLRQPQLKSAQTNVKSAKAQLKQAQLNLLRTEIKAPFDGRVRSKSVDIGQVVAANTLLADIYATDAVEIKLPVKNSELKLLDLPTARKHIPANTNEMSGGITATITSTLIDKEVWQGKIVRVAGAIDNNSRQLNLTAQISDPYGEGFSHKTPLKIGEYVTATIEGKTLENVIAIPNKSIYQGSYVYLYRDGKAFRKDIEIYWQNESQAVIKNGLNPNDELIITPLGQISSGTAVAKNTETDKNSIKPKKDKKETAHSSDT